MIKQRLSLVFLLLMGLVALSGMQTSYAEEELLEVSQAFQHSARAGDGNQIIASWKVSKDYYLYKNKFRFSTDTPGVILGDPVYPKAKIKNDEFFGKLEVYSKDITIKIPLTGNIPADGKVSFTAVSQGCAEKIGVCYPPQTQTSIIQLAGNITSPVAAPLSSRPLTTLNDLSSSLGLGNADNKILDKDVAFQFNHEVKGNAVIAGWNIAPDHYMYRDKFKFAITDTSGVQIGQVKYPKGDIKDDEFFGRIEVYHEHAELSIPLINPGNKTVTAQLKITYQGCAEKAGICYPPINKTIKVDVPPGGTAAAAVSARPASNKAIAKAEDGFVSEQDKSSSVLASGNIIEIMLYFFLGGLVLAFTACMYPMIPILSSIIVGHGEKITTGHAFTLSMVYVQSMAVTFGVLGAVVALFAGTINLQAYFQSPWILIPFAILFVLLALSMFGFYTIQLPASLQGRLSQISNEQKSGSLVGVAIMGMLSALIIGPCAGPVVIGALAVAAKEGDMVMGFLSMFVLGNGLGLPLLIVGTTGGKFLPKAGNWMNVVKAGAGVILLAIALLFLERISFISATLIMVLWSVLLIVVAVYLGAFERIKQGTSGWRKFWKGLGLVFFIYGIIVMLGGLTGARNFNDPMHGSQLLGSGGGAKHAQLKFKRIKTVANLQFEIAKAKDAGKYVMLDFYADWCTYCKQFEDYVFSNADVQALLKDFVLLQADITKNDKFDQRLLAYTKVQAPPAILFFNKNSGEEQRRYRIVGAMNAHQFIDRVQLVLKLREQRMPQ